MEKPRCKVGMPLRLLCILCSPFLIYMARRMNKVRKALVIVAVDFAIDSIARYLMPFPYDAIVELCMFLPFLIYFVNKWSREWNREIDKQNSQPLTEGK